MTAGIYYGAGEDARPFLDSMDAVYLSHLRARCAWAASTFGALDDDEIRARLGAVFGTEDIAQTATDMSYVTNGSETRRSVD